MADSSSAVFAALGSLQDTRSSMANTQMYSATTYMQKKDYKKAVAALKLATAYDPSQTKAYSLMAQSYLSLNDTKSAKAAYQMVIRLDKSNDAAYTGMANIDMANKNYTDAEKELKQAIRINPTDVVAPDTLGQLYLTTGRNQEAATQFQKVAKMAPTDGNPYYSLGVAYDKMGKYSDAVTVLKKAVALKKDFALGFSELGNAYAKLGQTDNAQKQVVALKAILTTQAQGLATTLAAQIKQPKIASMNGANSSLALTYRAMTPLHLLDPTFPAAPGASKDYTLQFQFDSVMDAKSVMTASNWSISRAAGGTAGRYENGLVLDSSNEASFSPVPKKVSYDATTGQATLTFSISQGADPAKTVIDPAHIVFKFFGKDLNGKTMDPTADQYDGFAGKAF